MIELKRKRKNSEGIVQVWCVAAVALKREMMGGERSEPLNEGSRRCGKAAFLRVRKVAGTPKAAVRR